MYRNVQIHTCKHTTYIHIHTYTHTYIHLYVNKLTLLSIPYTIVREKFGVKNFHQMPGMTKIKHTKLFLPQRNRAVYNGLQPAKTKIFYHRFFSHEHFQPLIFPKLQYVHYTHTYHTPMNCVYVCKFVYTR